MREDPLSGETRLVWGCGGRAEMLLFEGEFLAINVRRVPKTWTMDDVIVNYLSSSGAIRDSFFLSKSENPAFQTARILFTCRKKASQTLKVFNLTKLCVLSSRLTMHGFRNCNELTTAKVCNSSRPCLHGRRCTRKPKPICTFRSPSQHPHAAACCSSIHRKTLTKFWQPGRLPSIT